MNRRDFVRSAAGVATSALLPGCCGTICQRPSGPFLKLADIHCHLFNGSDLPVVRFVKIVLLHDYPREGIATLDIRNPDAVDGMIMLLTWIVGRTAAPSAVEEVRILDGAARAKVVNRVRAVNEKSVIDTVAAFTMDKGFAVAAGMSPNGPPLVRQAILSAASGGGFAVSDVPLSKEEAQNVAERAFRSSTNIGRYLRWFALFTRYRHALAEELSELHRCQGFEPLILCPAAVDYDFWLGERVDASPMPDQVTVMGRLARRTTGTPVHGYVGFDPLRQAYRVDGKFPAYDPLELVRRAIVEEGFIGVKLYPPMGFKPLENESDACQTYPADPSTIDPVADLAPGAASDPAAVDCKVRPTNGSRIVGRKLDAALESLFDLCVREDASVLAHSNHSNASNKDYGARADPAFWVPVFKRWPSLRVSLGHFGHFAYRAAHAPASTPLPEASWEWALGNYIKSIGDPPVFADISFLTEIFGKSPEELAAYAQKVQRWVQTFDPECRHLLFGTDWSMLGIDADAERFTRGIYDFFRQSCGFDEVRLDRLFFGNAGRFLGLRRGDRTRDRLLQFYARNGIPVARLPEFAVA